MDVYMNEKDLNLLLLQYPLKPNVANELFENITSVKYKPIHEKLEISSIVSGSLENEDSNCSGRAITHVSSSVISNSQLMIGVVRNNALHITALQNQQLQSSVLQMRPLIIRKEEELMPIPSTTTSNNTKDTHHKELHSNNNTSIDSANVTIKMEHDGEIQEETGDLQQIYMKRKENDKAYSSRIQSYSTFMNTLNEEAYVPMQFHPLGN